MTDRQTTTTPSDGKSSHGLAGLWPGDLKTEHIYLCFASSLWFSLCYYFPSLIKIDCHKYNWNIVESGIKHTIHHTKHIIHTQTCTVHNRKS